VVEEMEVGVEGEEGRQEEAVEEEEINVQISEVRFFGCFKPNFFDCNSLTDDDALHPVLLSVLLGSALLTTQVQADSPTGQSFCGTFLEVKWNPCGCSSMSGRVVFIRYCELRVRQIHSIEGHNLPCLVDEFFTLIYC
jgi:hypothetical protein